MVEQSTLTSESYAALEGDRFSLQLADDKMVLELIEVKKMGNGERQGGAFSLLWQGPQAPALPQATYSVSHDKLGTHDLFLVPVAQVDAGIQYEAVFT